MKKLFLCALLISFTELQVAAEKTFVDRALAAAAQSEMAHQWNNLLSRRLCFLGLPASNKLEMLASEAQKAVGIPEARLVSVRVGAADDAAAIARINAIYVNPTTFENSAMPHGVKRCDMHHEAVHIKYHDMGCSRFLKLVATLGAPIAIIASRPQGWLKVLYPLSVIAGLIVGVETQKKYIRYCERRADNEGHVAIGCHRCVREKIEDIRGIPRKACYLSIAENEAIAAELEGQGKLCDFHRGQRE